MPSYNTMIASVSFVLTRNLICNFPQTGEISNFPLYEPVHMGRDILGPPRYPGAHVSLCFENLSIHMKPG